MTHLGVTGTQRGLTEAQHATATSLLRTLCLGEGCQWMHNGDCVGADAELARIWRSWVPAKIHLHPPSNPSRRAFLRAEATEQPLPYLERNHAIVQASAVMLACPGESFEVLSSGTWATIRYARKLGRRLTIIFPNGDTLCN